MGAEVCRYGWPQAATWDSRARDLHADPQESAFVYACVRKRCPQWPEEHVRAATELCRRVLVELYVVLSESGDPPDPYWVSYHLDKQTPIYVQALRRAMERASRR